MIPQAKLDLSGERIKVWYRLQGNHDQAFAKAEDICLEQTVEFPAELVPEGDIHDQILGRIESFQELEGDHFLTEISYAIETTGFELTQLLNVIFGNISIKPGIRVERLEMSPSLYQVFPGPRFGRAGLRQWLKVPTRPLLCTALKPMGLSACQLAEFAYQFALGGIDIIKDDHGLADQPFSPFEERVQYCAEAVERANRQTGLHCIYMPNVSAPADQLLAKALFAKQAGAGGLLVSPGLTGFDAIRLLASDERIALPLMSHPAMQGSFVTNPESGLSHYALFGQLTRLAGADASIYPNYGGRFSFSREECQSIVAGTSVPMGSLKSIFPAPGGGMKIERLPDMLDVYGREVLFLMGGGLHQQGADLVENCRDFLRIVEQI